MWESLIVPAILFRRFPFPFEYLRAGEERFVCLDVYKRDAKVPCTAEVKQIEELYPRSHNLSIGAQSDREDLAVIHVAARTY